MSRVKFLPKKSDDLKRGFCLPACSLLSLSIIAQVVSLSASLTFQGRGFRLPGNGGERQLSWRSDVLRLSSVEQAVRQLLLRVITTCTGGSREAVKQQKALDTSSSFQEVMWE